MALVKHNNNSISAVTSMASLTTGSMTLISEQTASSSASISFTSGIDSTYPIYKFEIINMNPATTNAIFEFQGNASGGSGFNETITSTSFRAYHRENDSDSSLQYVINDDQAQGTDYQHLANGVGNGSDESLCLELFLFNPSSTTFVKHFMARCIFYEDSNMPVDHYTAGYFNTTSAIDEIAFRMHTGNIDSGTFKLYGIRDS
jgi:hypothetical protein